MNTAQFSPVYQSAVNSITRPDRYVFVSRYLVEKWLPDLGPNAFAILCFLRRECYHNRQTGELRNEVTRLAMLDIAAGCQLSVSTVRRELQNNKVLQRFVSVSREFVHEGRRNGLRQDRNSYTVSMDDPVHPADEALLTDRVNEAIARREKGPEDPKERARRNAAVTPRQNDGALNGQCVKVEPVHSKMTRGGVKMNVPTCQNDAALIESFLSPKKTLQDAAVAAPDSSASLSQEQKEPDRPKTKSREEWQAEDSSFARDYCRRKGWARAEAMTAREDGK